MNEEGMVYTQCGNYPSFIEDEIDKIIFDTVQNSKWGLTTTQLKNKLFEALFTRYGKENFNLKIEKFKESGLFDVLEKETTIKIIRKK